MSVTTSQATTLLENVLFEQPSIAAANAATWVVASNISSQSTIAGLAAAMSATAEAGIAQQVIRYYMGALGRVPSGSEIQFYVKYAEQGLSASAIAQGSSSVPVATWSQIANFFANSPEFSHDYGITTPGSVDSSNEGLVITAFYNNVLNRAPTSSEIIFYENALNSGTPVQTLIQYFTNSPEYQNTVNSGLATALASYGASVTNGNTPSTIPFFLPGQVLSETLTASALTVTGTNASIMVTVTGTAAQSAQSAVTAVAGVFGIAPVTAATGVQGVTGVTQVTPVAGQTAQTAVTDGAVTINDANSSATGTGTITTVTLLNSGAGSVINDNALATLNLTGTTGTLAITNSNTAAITAHGSTLALTLNGLSAAANTITDSNNEISTLNVTTATADSVLAGFTDSHLTTLSVTGTNKLTLNAINSSLTSLTVSGAASFSDGAHIHGTGLAALGGALAISVTSTGTFAAVLDDTSQSFTGAAGADTITVSDLADATKTITGGSAANNEIVFEGGPYGLTSASSGKFVNFQTVGVAGNVSGTIDLSQIDATASTLEVLGNSNVTFAKAAKGAALLVDPGVGAGATVTVKYADSTGASDSTSVTLSSAVSGLTLQDSAGVGVATLAIANNLASGETIISPAHTLYSLTDNGLATLTVSGNAGLAISALNETGTMATGFTLNNSSTNDNGVTIGALNDSALASIAFTGTGLSNVSVNTSAASFTVTNGGNALNGIGTLTDASLTSLTLPANVALGQASTALTTNGLQDSSTAGVTVSGAADNAHVTVNLTAGAASGKTDSITLGNGNNVVVDASAAGAVNITLGSGANLVELGTGSLNTTAHYTVTLAARTATPPNAIYVGAAGTNYASAPSVVVTGATTGDIIAFGNDSSSSGAALTATSLSGQSSVAGAIAALEAAVSGAADKVAYGVYGGNTYIVETTTGTVGATDTAVIEVTGAQTLFASVGYVTLGSAASPSPGGSLSGAGFTIPAGSVSNPNPLILGNNGNVVTMVGATAGITDTFKSGINAGALTINYQATAASTGTDTIQMSGSQGANKSDVTALTVNDTSTGSAGVTIGAFTDDNLTTATYNNSAATGATMTQSALTSSSLTTINLTGGVALQATNAYFITATLSTTGGVTINDTNVGAGTTTMGLTLSNGPSALTLSMTGPGTLATGTLADDNLASLTIQGSGTGAVNIGALTDAYAGGFTVTDTSTSTGGTVMILSGLSKAVSLTVNDSSAGALTDNSAYTDPFMTSMTVNDTGAAALSLGAAGITVNALTSLTLKNTSSKAVTLGAGGITANSLTTIAIQGSGTGTISTGQITDTVTAAFTLTDQSSSTSAATLDLSQLSAAATVTVADSAAGALSVGNISDTAATAMSFSNSGSALLTVGSVTAPGVTGASATTSLTFANSNSGSLTVGAVSAAALTNLSVTASGSGALTLASLSVPLATSLTFTNNGSSALTVTGAISSNVLSTLTIADGASGTLTLGALTDNVTTGFTLNDNSVNTGGFTFNVAALPTASSIIVNDSAKGALTIGAITDPDAATLIFNNTGSALLTVTDIVDNASAVAMTIESMQGSTSVSSTGGDVITIDNGGSGTSFSLTDSSASTGAATVTYDSAITAGPGTFSVTDSAAGALTVTAFTDNDLTGATLVNSGTATLTLSGIANTTASGATLFTTLTLGDATLGGSGKIVLTALTLANDTGPMAISNYQSGAVTIGTLTLGSAANPSGGLTVTDNAGAGVLTIGASASLSPVYATSITLADNSSSGAINAFLTDSATAATSISLTGTGAQSLTLTDSAATLNVTLSGATNNLALTESSPANTINLTIGTGTNTISLPGHTTAATLSFSAASASNLNISPVTADKITGFVLDGGSTGATGDALNLTGFSSTSVIHAADANSYTATGVWSSTVNGILSQSGASVLNFITDVQNVTQAGGAAGTPGIAAFLDTANNNTWIAYNDGAGHVAVIELVGVLATGGIESGSPTANAIHLT